MKKLPEVNAGIGDLYRMVFAPIRMKLVLTGIELKVFNHLSEPRSANDMAKVIGTHPRNTRVFLNGLVAIDLLQKKDGLYRNSTAARDFLVESSPTYFGGGLQIIQSWTSLENLTKLVKEGPPPPTETSPLSEEMIAETATMYASGELAIDAPIMVEIASNLPEFPSIRKMLDLGGGPGLIGIAIVAAHPNMKGVIFDLPPMVKIADTFIKRYEMEERVEVLGGDFYRDSIGEGYDLILACSSMQGDKDRLDSVVRKVYDALNPGGVFISYFCGLTREETKPEIHVLSLLSMALKGHDAGFYQGFVVDSMLRVGFKSVRSQTLDTPYGPMELDIARR